MILGFFVLVVCHFAQMVGIPMHRVRRIQLQINRLPVHGDLVCNAGELFGCDVTFPMNNLDTSRRSHVSFPNAGAVFHCFCIHTLMFSNFTVKHKSNNAGRGSHVMLIDFIQ